MSCNSNNNAGKATAAAAAATSIDNNRSNSNGVNSTSNKTNNNDPSMNSCIRLLQEILVEQPYSRPRILLQALMGVSGRNTASAATAATTTAADSSNNNNTCTFRALSDGIEIQIPMDEPPDLDHPKKWTDVQPPPQQAAATNTTTTTGFVANLNRNGTALATSARVVSSPNDEHDNNAAAADNKKHIERIKIQCRPCKDTGPEGNARAMIMGPNPLSIVACTNRLKLGGGPSSSSPSPPSSSSSPLQSCLPSSSNTAEAKEEMESILVHELIHAYDIQRLKLDFSHCESMAYSEVRAAREAECYENWSFMKDSCVKRKAIAATNNLFPSNGRQCVTKVFQTALRDKRPFHDNNNNNNNNIGHQNRAAGGGEHNNNNHRHNANNNNYAATNNNNNNNNSNR